MMTPGRPDRRIARGHGRHRSRHPGVLPARPRRSTRTRARRWPWSGRGAPKTCRRCCAGPPPTGSPSCRAEWAPGCPAARRRWTAAIVLSTEKMRDITVDPVTRTAVVPARAAQRRGQEGGRRVRTVVSAGPVVVRDLQHRRQHRHQRRRAVLREVRRHHRLRAGAAGGAGRRHRGAPRRPAAQGRRGALA